MCTAIMEEMSADAHLSVVLNNLVCIVHDSINIVLFLQVMRRINGILLCCDIVALLKEVKIDAMGKCAQCSGDIID